MHVVELFLPLKTRDGSDQPRALFDAVRRELLERFGGLTAFSRAPAEGLWEDPQGAVEQDMIIIFEIMAGTLERDWWATFRKSLEARFDQDEILVRAYLSERL